MNINSNYGIILHPFPFLVGNHLFPDVSFEWWDVRDACCDKSNHWTKTRAWKGFGWKGFQRHTQKLIMRQTKASFRETCEQCERSCEVNVTNRSLRMWKHFCQTKFAFKFLHMKFCLLSVARLFIIIQTFPLQIISKLKSSNVR